MINFKFCVLFFMSAVIFSCVGNNPVIKVPEAAQRSFVSRYGTDKEVQWKKTGENDYQAVFQSGHQPAVAFYDRNGNWLKTETELKSNELPLVIVETVKNAFRGSSISKSFQVEKNSGENTFLISLKRGNRVREVELSSGGVILSDE
ncbi:MAG TPA: PepSY-like domain-containing protein [Bacteroidales bacterium]|nr:PepSY-like domain-containing protein [Bacteroidales bacterium]